MNRIVPSVNKPNFSVVLPPNDMQHSNNTHLQNDTRTAPPTTPPLIPLQILQLLFVDRPPPIPPNHHHRLHRIHFFEFHQRNRH